MNETPPKASRSRMWPFLLWLAVVYCVWLMVVIGGGHWDTVRSHWPIAVAMALGSYVAGSTPMGGGTVGFPVLVLIFGHPGSLGRNFALAVQSIGMVSAGIFIFSSGRKLDRQLLHPALVGSLIGTPIGAAFVAPFVSDMWIKLTFAIVWSSFGIMHLMKLKELTSAHRANDRFRTFDRPIGLAVGVAGGIVASIVGVGSEMLAYATLVLLYRADLKVVIPTAVVLGAFTSVVGITINILLGMLNPGLYAVAPEVFSNWLAAVPIVVLGAPLGAIVVNYISRTSTLLTVSVLCILQLVWMLIHERVSGVPLVAALLGVLAMNLLFQALYRWGRGECLLPDNAVSDPSPDTTTVLVPEPDESQQ